MRLQSGQVSEYSLTMPVSARDRLLSAALKLFAAKGYAATSVADIQRAAGLAPGSGALYKHFGSKRELLEAAVAHRIDSIVAAREQYDAGEPGSVEQAVRTAGQLIWNNLKQSEDLLKVMLREPDELGDLDEKVWQVITDNAYQRFAGELNASNRSGRTRIPDPEAAAAAPSRTTANTAPTQPEISNGSRPSAPHKNPAHSPAASTAKPLKPWKTPWALDCSSPPTSVEIQAFPTPS